MIYDMKVRNQPIIEIRKDDTLIRVHPDGSHYHEANVPGYIIYAGNHNRKNGIGLFTMDDLKELRRVVRKAIRDESYKSIQG